MTVRTNASQTLLSFLLDILTVIGLFDGAFGQSLGCCQMAGHLDRLVFVSQISKDWLDMIYNNIVRRNQGKIDDERCCPYLVIYLTLVKIVQICNNCCGGIVDWIH